MLEELKKRVFEENIALVKHGLVVLTWGNVSARDQKTGLIVIKPSGVPYDTMRAEDMVVVDIEGNKIEGELNPSSDLPTHLYLYRCMPECGGIVHTHSTYATAFAQSGREIPPYGTTHADAFYGPVPCSRELSDEEIATDYEKNTGAVIVETVSDYLAVPAVLVKNHGVFTWGKSPEKAVETAVTLEEVAKMASITESLNRHTTSIKQTLLDKHYLRKHGKNAYYGQKSRES
jgi:L-ribulose-5-phosphate 4-epimerase